MTVPVSWIYSDHKNTYVRWPPVRNIPVSWRKNGSMMPDTNWSYNKCIIKRNFKTYNEAYNEEIVMANQTETDELNSDEMEEEFIIDNPVDNQSINYT